MLQRDGQSSSGLNHRTLDLDVLLAVPRCKTRASAGENPFFASRDHLAKTRNHRLFVRMKVIVPLDLASVLRALASSF